MRVQSLSSPSILMVMTAASSEKTIRGRLDVGAYDVSIGVCGGSVGSRRRGAVVVLRSAVS